VQCQFLITSVKNVAGLSIAKHPLAPQMIDVRELKGGTMQDLIKEFIAQKRFAIVGATEWYMTSV